MLFIAQQKKIEIPIHLNTQQMSHINNPLAPFSKGNFFDAPFIKWEFLKSPLEKGDSGGCLVYYDTNFEIPIHLTKK